MVSGNVVIGDDRFIMLAGVEELEGPFLRNPALGLLA
jgi:hypothetical protein